MEQKFGILRKHLNELGYHQTLSYDSVPLVEQLLGDLVKTTESLFQYKNVAQAAIEERDQLQLGAEPYKCDNAKLVQECNDLHLAFIQFKEQTDKLQRDLKHQIESLEKENQDLSRTVDRLRRTSDRASSGYSTRRTIPSKTSLRHSATSVETKSSKSGSKEKHICNCRSDKMGKEEMHCLRQENCRLKSDLIKQLELTETLAEKLDTRDEEIKRLTGLLEGGRPLEALNADCCYKEVTSKLAKISDENCKLKYGKEDLESQLAEAIRKQHEAMKRALMLADRNKELERELHDIDQMALAVEAECNCKVKEHIDKAARYQEELEFAHKKIEMLERQVSEFRRKRSSIDTDYLNAQEEKENLHRILETALDDKRRMTDRMNQFQKIEHDLNTEIDKLAQTCTCQKRKIADLETQLANQKMSNKGGKTMHTCMCKDKRGGDHSPDKQSRGSSPGKRSKVSSPGKKSREVSPNKDSAPKNKDDKNKTFIEKLTKERNEFQNKCKTLQEQLEKLNSSQKVNKQSSPSKIQGGDTLKRNLKEKDEKISKLEKNIQNLTREKHELMTKLEESNKGTSNTLKSASSKAEKERDMARGDCKRLEEERDALRQRLKQVTEQHSAETEKLQRLVAETEQKLLQLENERREMVTVQGSRRATINSLEEKVESLSSQLRTSQSELDHIKTLHTQLKTLHEQTDRALADSQGQLNQVECEYAKACNKICDLDKNRVDMECECNRMKQDLALLKAKFCSVDGERDNLMIEIDNKTERIANLEMELNAKQNKMMSLEKMVMDLQQKLSSYTDELSTKEYLIKNNSAEINTVRRSLDEALKDKTSATMENKRLQEDFAKVTYECKCVNGELDRAKREIDDLKTQLQQYVYEIKRAEDLISKKEIERSEMLDQFRNLSEETTVLESNNHTLESQAIEVRNQLSAATNHIHDLESRIEQFTTLNKDYERQISQMTKQIASLETQVRQSGAINKNVESEISDMKCLCVKLDEQKETLKKECKQRDDFTRQLEIEKEHLKSELNNLQDALHKETSNIGSLENLLATCRQETVEQRLLNQELQSEIHRLKNMVQELQNKLSINGGYNGGYNSGSTKHCIHVKERETGVCSSPLIQNKIPEKTILDEVCLHRTLYCSGTQQNLQAHPEQRNVAIQQIFHSEPEYVERNNEYSSKNIDEAFAARFGCTCKCSVCTGGRTCNNESRKTKYVCGDGMKPCPTKTSTYPIIEEEKKIEKPQKTIHINIEREAASDRRRSSPPGLIRNSKFWKDPPEPITKKSVGVQKFQPTGSMRNSAFWREEEPPEKTIGIQSVPVSEPAIRRKPTKVQQFRGHQSEAPIKPLNALDHDTFHGEKPPVAVKPPRESIITAEEEAAMMRSRRKSQALTLQKFCLLRKTLNLNDSRTKLIYRTELSNTNSPFRSKYVDECSRKTSIEEIDDDSDTVLVIPEACKYNMVDGTKSVKFSRKTRCQTVDDIDAKYRKFLHLHSNDCL